MVVLTFFYVYFQSMRMVCDMVSQDKEGFTWCVQGQAASPHQPKTQPI